MDDGQWEAPVEGGTGTPAKGAVISPTLDKHLFTTPLTVGLSVATPGGSRHASTWRYGDDIVAGFELGKAMCRAVLWRKLRGGWRQVCRYRCTGTKNMAPHSGLAARAADRSKGAGGLGNPEDGHNFLGFTGTSVGRIPVWGGIFSLYIAKDARDRYAHKAGVP